MDYVLRAEDDECVCRALFAGMFSDCRLDFGFGAKPKHGVYISNTCWHHGVFLPNNRDERQHGSGIPGKYHFLYIFLSCLCLSATGTV